MTGFNAIMIIKHILWCPIHILNTLRPRQNSRHFPDDIFKWIFLNENVWISINISLKFVPRGPINNIPTLVQVMAWHRPGDKPLSEPMMVRLPMHICVTRPQWVKEVVSDNRNSEPSKIMLLQVCLYHLGIYPLHQPHIIKTRLLRNGKIYDYDIQWRLVVHFIYERRL